MHRDGIYKTWGRSKLYLENCGQEVTYQNVTYLCIHLSVYGRLHFFIHVVGLASFFVKRARVLASTQIPVYYYGF